HAAGRGYEEISVPYMVRREIMVGTGQLPKFEEDLFRVESGGREWFLIPTAEVPVTNIYADEIIDPKDLPQRFCCYTACFRAEAGSHGQDVKGIIRQHQFHKVELVHFATEADSWTEYDRLVASAQSCLDTLGLHYRLVNLCAGDVGFSARFCCDLEVWLPAQNRYREISSCSNFGDFQARRAKIRTKIDGKTQLVHTMNGSGMPIGRTLVAILEQFQQEDGSVVIPEALRKYTGFLKMLPGGKTE
ncbi:MAG: serine--tRNA ligase, partial [bacterium]